MMLHVTRRPFKDHTDLPQRVKPVVPMSRRTHHRASGDYAERIAIGVSQNNEVGIIGVVPVDPLSAQGDQTLDLGLLIGLIVSPEVRCVLSSFIEV
jgi:hypothetical protein